MIFVDHRFISDLIVHAWDLTTSASLSCPDIQTRGSQKLVLLTSNYIPVPVKSISQYSEFVVIFQSDDAYNH